MVSGCVCIHVTSTLLLPLFFPQHRALPVLVRALFALDLCPYQLNSPFSSLARKSRRCFRLSSLDQRLTGSFGAFTAD